MRTKSLKINLMMGGCIWLAMGCSSKQSVSSHFHEGCQQPVCKAVDANPMIRVGTEPSKKPLPAEQHLRRLQQQGLKLSQIGDEIKIYLPAKQYFMAQSPRMQDTLLPILPMIRDLVNTLPTQVVQVAGFTAEQGARKRNEALSQARADLIVDRLSELGLDARLLFAMGYGELGPLTTRHGLGVDQINDRVEIVLNPHYRYERQPCAD